MTDIYLYTILCMCSCVANLPTCRCCTRATLSNPLTVVLGIREADVCLVYNKHMPNQSLCSYTLLLNINPGLRVCQWRQVLALNMGCHEVLCLSDRKCSVKVDKTAAIVGECIEPAWNKLIHMSYAALSVTVQI